jgi:hypothetical protein
MENKISIKEYINAFSCENNLNLIALDYKEVDLLNIKTVEDPEFIFAKDVAQSILEKVEELVVKNYYSQIRNLINN